MPATPRSLCDQTYALRLLGPAAEIQTLTGELEHVLSGDCVAFQSGAGLLAALVQLQTQRQEQRQAQRQEQRQAQRQTQRDLAPVSADHSPAIEG